MRRKELVMSTAQPRPDVQSGRATTARPLHLTNPLMTGPDVVHLQTLLATYHPGKVDGEYGPATAAAVKQAKWALGYPDAKCDQSAGPQLVLYLEGADLPADVQARRAARPHDQAKAPSGRE